MSNFRDLLVWQRSKQLAVAIYKVTGVGAWLRDRGLQDQIRRAAVSVPSNLAEGNGRLSDKDSNRFFMIANGSLCEVSTQLEIAMEIGYITKDEFVKLDKEIDEIGKMLGSLIRSRKVSIDTGARH